MESLQPTQTEATKKDDSTCTKIELQRAIYVLIVLLVIILAAICYCSTRNGPCSRRCECRDMTAADRCSGLWSGSDADKLHSKLFKGHSFESREAKKISRHKLGDALHSAKQRLYNAQVNLDVLVCLECARVYASNGSRPCRTTPCLLQRQSHDDELPSEPDSEHDESEMKPAKKRLRPKKHSTQRAFISV